MKKVFFLLAALIILQSCVETKPFRVGDNIDASHKIVNMDNIEPSIDSIVDYICSNKLTNVAMCDFVDTLNNKIDDSGRYLSFNLKSRVIKRCNINIKIGDYGKWINMKNKKLIVKTQKGFKYFILGTYRYRDGGYDLFVRVLDLNKDSITVTFAKRICNDKIEFNIDTLHIPQEVVIEPIW